MSESSIMCVQLTLLHFLITLVDILAKLSRVLETQSLGDTTTDGASTQEMIAKISAQIDDVSIRDSTTGPSNFHDRAVLTSSGKVQLPNRKLPYEVWAEQNPVNQFIKTPSKMANKDRDKLVERLHSTNKSKEASANAKSNANLVEELRHLNFRPEMNKMSMQYNKGRENDLQTRQKGDLEKKKIELDKQRKLQIEEEMKECSFKPTLGFSLISNLKSDDKKIKEIIEKGNKSAKAKEQESSLTKDGKVPKKKASAVADRQMIWEKEKETRRAQRKQIVEEMEERELSFAPHLNRRSMLLTAKMKKTGKYTVDNATGQTQNIPNKRRADTHESLNSGGVLPGHEEESFHPSITGRAGGFTPQPHRNGVFGRLYDHAVDKHVRKHNEQAELRRNLVQNVPEAEWESQVRKVGEASETVRRQMEAEWKEKPRREGAMIDDSEDHPINVLEFDTKYSFILEKISFSGGV